MIKKTTFLKTLLVAAGLLVGQSNVWGQTTTLMEYGTNDVAWTAEGLATWTAGGTPTFDNEENPTYVGITGSNGSYETSKAITPTANAIINVTAVWRGASATGRAFTAGNGSYFRFGNIYVAQNDQDKKHGYGFTGISNIASATTFAAGSYRVDVTSSTWLKIEAEINTATNTLTSFTIKSEDGATTYATVSDVALTNPDYTTVAFGYKKTGSVSTTNKEQLKSVKITQTAQAVTNADYTINYKLGDNIVKSVAGTGVVGQEITADIAVDGTEAGYEDKHYLVIAAEAPSMTLVADAASNVLNIPVRAPYTATLKVTTTIGTNEPALVETPLTETDAKVHTWSYAYPMYVKDGEKYYVADDITSFGDGGEFTDGQVIEKSVTYSTVDEDVVFFCEAEASAGTNYTYSNGGSGYVGAQNARDRGISVGTLPAGTYQFIVNITAANRRSLGIRQSTNDHLASVGTSTEDLTTGIKSAIFALDAETADLYINGANSGTVKTNQSENFDYVLIKKATVPVDIKADGSTFSSAYAIDCANLPSGVKAYKVTKMTASEVTAEEVTEAVAANTGLILVATAADSYNIPVAATGTDISASNLLKAAVAATEVAADEAYGLKDGKFHKLNAGTISAGKAYLLADDIAKAPELTINFGGEATGIADVRGKMEDVRSDFFDLQGRKVANPTKGLYIQNGRKVILK